MPTAPLHCAGAGLPRLGGGAGAAGGPGARPQQGAPDPVAAVELLQKLAVTWRAPRRRCCGSTSGAARTRLADILLRGTAPAGAVSYPLLTYGRA